MKKEAFYLIIVLSILIVFAYLVMSKDSCGNNVRCLFLKAVAERNPDYCNKLDDVSKEDCLRFVKIGFIEGISNMDNKGMIINYLKYTLVAVSIAAIIILIYLIFIYFRLLKSNSKENKEKMAKDITLEERWV